MNFALARLTEPSTYAGLGVLAQLAKNFVPELGPAADIISTVAGAAAVGLAEKNKPAA